MSSRTSNLRAKIFFLLASLAALWAFAAFVTLREGLNLFWISTLDQEVGRPTDALVATLQAERRASAVVLAGQDGPARAELQTARAATDAAAARFRDSVRGTTASMAASEPAQQNIAELTRMLDGLGPVRADVDQRSGERAQAVAYYTKTIGVGYRIFATIASFDDKAINDQLRHLLIMSRGRELLSQEDALMSGVLAAGRFTAADAAEFAQLVGAQRNIRATGLEGLPAADRAIYDPVLTGPAMTRLRQVEDLLVERARAGEAPPVGGAEWRSSFDPALTALAQLDIDLAEATIVRAQGPIVLVIVRLVLAAGLGLIAVVASVVLSITTARAIVQQLRRLRDAADELANVRLPRVVQRLRAGEEVDVIAEAPPLAVGHDEIGQVGQAFNAAQETAVRAAVEQAELRRSVRDLFLSLARRSQTLVHRQLGMLDAMERRTTDAAELDELFRIDHLATRMRRNAENLIVLAGAVPGRGWRRTVPMVDVIRAAVAEVEEYPRVNVLPSETAGLSGHAVGDVVHLLAELMENALAFSPRHTLVNVGGSEVGAGYVIEVEDHGLGMTSADLDEANAQLQQPAEFLLTSTPRLGLYVVGRLAERHGVKVRLQPSPGGGTTAVVLIPSSLVADTWPTVSGLDSGEHQVIEASPEPGADHDVPAGRGTHDGLPVRTRPEGSPFELPQRRSAADAAPPVPAPAALATTGAPAPAPATAAPATAAANGIRVNGSAPARLDDATAAVPGQRTPVERTVYTPSGLPVRNRPAAPAVPLAERPDETVPAAQPRTEALATAPRRAPDAVEEGHALAAADDAPGDLRAASQVYSLIAAYQQGSRRGRLDAEQLTAPAAAEPAAAPTAAAPTAVPPVAAAPPVATPAAALSAADQPTGAYPVVELLVSDPAAAPRPAPAPSTTAEPEAAAATAVEPPAAPQPAGPASLTAAQEAAQEAAFSVGVPPTAAQGAASPVAAPSTAAQGATAPVTGPDGAEWPRPRPEDRPPLPRRPSPRTSPRNEEGKGV
ncbi:sensor histidine kinase [Catellatospora sp. NPDC049609]|uniref:sensor histidine kinase n=1 Tax=Catellatospora sp. NPDC049609 TaxID=3155505 RepID=UPI0034288097